MDNTEEQLKLDDILKQQREALQSINVTKGEEENVKKNIEELKKEEDRLTAEIESLNADVDSASITRSTKLSVLSVIQDQIREASALLESTKTANDKAMIDGKKNSDILQTEQDRIVLDAKNKVEALETRKNQLSNEIQPLTDQIARFNEQLLPLNQKLDSVRSLVTEAESKVSTLKDTEALLKRSVVDLQSIVDNITLDIKVKTKSSEILDNDIDSKNQTILSLNKEITSLEIELENNNDQNAEFLKSRADLIAGRQEVDQRLAFLKSKYEDLNEPWG